MSRNTKGVAPVVTTESDGRNTTRHPAFGCLSINRVSGGSRNFFGSDVRHDHYISLRVSTARVWGDESSQHVSDEQSIVEVAMTPAQFCEAITSPGVGCGVPVTLKRVRTGGTLEDMPDILDTSSFEDKAKGEMRAFVNAELEKINAAVDKIMAVGNDKTISKKKFNDAMFTLVSHLGNLPANMEFANTLLNERVEKAMVSAKAEIEAFTTSAIMNAGIKSLNGLPTLQLEHVQTPDFDAVIAFGPVGCGKTKFAEKIRVHYHLDRIVDDMDMFKVGDLVTSFKAGPSVLFLGVSEVMAKILADRLAAEGFEVLLATFEDLDIPGIAYPEA